MDFTALVAALVCFTTAGHITSPASTGTRARILVTTYLVIGAMQAVVFLVSVYTAMR